MPEEAWFRSDGDSVAGSGHRRQHRHLQLGRLDSAQAPARARQITTLANRDNNGPLGQYFSWPRIEAIRSQTGQSFGCVFGYSLSLDALAERSQQPQRVFAGYVSGNSFLGLGLNPVVGRLFLPAKEKFRTAGRRLCSRTITGSRDSTTIRTWLDVR
jgi:hypothetical protein